MEELVGRLEAMLAQGQDNMLLRYALGKAYVEQESYEQAVVHLRAALNFDPHYSVAWKWLGKALLGLSDQAGARRAWQAGVAAAQERGDQQLLRELGVFLKRLERAGA